MGNLITCSRLGADDGGTGWGWKRDGAGQDGKCGSRLGCTPAGRAGPPYVHAIPSGRQSSVVGRIGLPGPDAARRLHAQCPSDALARTPAGRIRKVSEAEGLVLVGV